MSYSLFPGVCLCALYRILHREKSAFDGEAKADVEDLWLWVMFMKMLRSQADTDLARQIILS